MKRTTILLAILLAASGSIVGSWFGHRAFALRNSAGTYSLPALNPVVTGTTITSAWANNTMSDISTTLTNSLDRTGKGGMQAALALYAGSVSTPGLDFVAETNSGLYRAASHDLRMSINGVDSQTWNTTGSSVSLGFSQGVNGTGGGENQPMSVYQRIQAVAPAPQDAGTYPLGNDIWLMTRGPADLDLENWGLYIQANTNATIGSNETIVINLAGTLCPGTANNSAKCISESPATAQLCAPGTCGLEIAEDGVNGEFVDKNSWSITDTTHLVITFAHAHTAPFSIRQFGAIHVHSREVFFGNEEDSGVPTWFMDKNVNPILTLTNDITAPWPRSGLQFPISVTGTAGTNSYDLNYRNNSTNSCFNMIDNSGYGNLFHACEATLDGGGGQPPQRYNTTTFGGVYEDAGTFSTLILAAAWDVARIIGGGVSATPGVIAYMSNGAADAGGDFSVRNNQGSNTSFFDVNTTTGTTTAVGYACTGSTHCGTVVMSGGTATTTVVSGCHPICSDQTSVGGVYCSVSSTTLTIHAAGASDSINYFCF